MTEARRNEIQRPERDALIATIERTGSLKGAAAEIGVSRMTLWRWTRELGIEVTRTVKAA